MASAPAKNTNKNRTNTPRLGRGLSSLIGGPVQVEPPPPPPEGAPPPEGTPDGPSPSDKNPLQVVREADLPEGDAFEGETGRQSGDGAMEGRRRLRYLTLKSIGPSPFQPRSSISEEALQDLAKSIRESGVMQPIVVRERALRVGDEVYELIAGERRWRASMLAGLERIPAILAIVDDRTAAEWALIENIQREDLNPVDRAKGFRTLAEMFELTHGEVAERVGLDRATVANAIRLTELEAPILRMLADETISAGHGKALLGARAGEDRVALARRVAVEQWSVRALEDHIRAGLTAGESAGGVGGVGGGGGASGGAREAKERPAQIVALEKQLSEHLSAKVRIKTRAGANKGRVEIEFYDLDHFDAVMERIGFTPE